MTRRTLYRGMRRWLLSIAAVVCVVWIVGWVQSDFVGDEIEYTSQQNIWAVAHGGGDVVVVHATTTLYRPAFRGWSHVRRNPVPVRKNLPDRVVGVGGYGVCRFRTASTGSGAQLVTYDAITLPYWFLTLLSATPWLIVAWRHWRNRAARRIAAGLCGACGYDLRASPGRCPECGSIAQPAPSPA